MAYKSKFKGKEIDDKLDLVQELSEGISDIKEYIKNIPQEETDPVFSNSPAAGITDQDKTDWGNKQDNIEDLETIRNGANKGATAVQPTQLANVATSGSYNDLSDKPHIPAEVTEQKVSDWGFTKNTGTYIKPESGIPRTDLASDIQTSLDKADTALQSYIEQYQGTVTGVIVNGELKSPNSDGIVDLGTIEGDGEQQQLKTIFGNSIVGEGDVMDYSMEIPGAGTYTVESVVNPRIMRGGSIFSLIVERWVTINNGPTLNVRISSDGILDVSGAIGSIQTSYLASGVIPEEYMPKNVATLDDIQQADFEETDVESKAYIKNKTHYFVPYASGQQLVVDDTTIGTNIAPITDYFKIGGAVYRSADMLGVEFNCQNAGAPVFVTVVEELDSDGNPTFYLRHISGNSSAGAPIMFSPAGTVKTIDSVFIPENFATKGYVETAIAEAITSVINASY